MAYADGQIRANVLLECASDRAPVQQLADDFIASHPSIHPFSHPSVHPPTHPTRDFDMAKCHRCNVIPSKPDSFLLTANQDLHECVARVSDLLFPGEAGAPTFYYYDDV